MVRRVIILNDQASVTGGAATVALASARGLAAQGFEVTLFAAVGPIAPEIQGVPGLEVICLGQHEIVDDPNRRRAMRNGMANREAAIRLGKLLDGCDQADTVIHVHSWMKALSPLVLHTAIRRGFKVVLTMHDFFITCPTGRFFPPARGQDLRAGSAIAFLRLVLVRSAKLPPQALADGADLLSKSRAKSAAGHRAFRRRLGI